MKRLLLWLLVVSAPCAAFAASSSPAMVTNDLNNPHKGFMLWGTDFAAGAPANHYGATIFHVYAPWREIETADQVFDWGRFETNHLLPILATYSNATFVLRPVADYPDGQNSGITLFYTGGELQRDFPRFLIEAPLSVPYFPYTSCDGDGPGWTPDWNDPRMVTQLVDFVQAFGARYDGDPRITAIQVGLLGLWGEWHQSGCDLRAPSNTVKIAVREAYAAAFTNTPLQTRYARSPDSIGVAFGFHEDYFPSFTAPCVYGFPSCSDTGDWNLHYGFVNVNPAASNHWRSNPISGESPLASQKRAWSNDHADVMTVLRDYHFSFLGPAGGHEIAGNQARLLPMKRLLGYNLHLVRADWPDEVSRGVAFPVTVVFTNTGAAPCYHRFPLELALCEADGTPRWRGAFDADLRELPPGSNFVRTTLFDVGALTTGSYSVRVGILDPRTGEPGVRLQSAGGDARGRIALGTIEVVDPWGVDSDADGLPDGWELQHFGSVTNAAAGEDADGDGLSNRENYISGTEPTNRMSTFRLAPPSGHGHAGVRFASAVDRRYSVQRADSPVDEWVDVATNLPGTGGEIAVGDGAAPDAGVYRARVELP